MMCAYSLIGSIFTVEAIKNNLLAALAMDSGNMSREIVGNALYKVPDTDT